MPSELLPAPGGWDRVVGQEPVKAFLRNALRAGRLAHAYLFSGPEGAGMDAAAIELARAVLCSRGGDEACGECRDCRQTAALRHPNLHLHFPLPAARGEEADDDPLLRMSKQDLESVRAEVERKAADGYHAVAVPRATQIRINSIRQMRRQASLGSFDGGRAVFLLFDAGTMAAAAANALLKTLEEPSPGTLIVLSTSEPEAILPTVASRCQQVRFDPLGEDEIAAALAARLGIPAAAAGAAARLAGGSFPAAFRLAGEDLDGRRRGAVELLRAFLHRPPAEAAGAIRAASDGGRDETAGTLLLLQSWLRDAMLVSAGRGTEAAEGEEETLRKFVQRYPGIDYGAVCASIDRAVSDLRGNAYIPLVLHALRVELRRAARAAAGAHS